MAFNDDFWSNLDLDDIFEHVNMAVTTELPAKAKGDDSTLKLRSVCYSCPVCGKELITVSGFTGHVLKQHADFDKTGFKASNYRKVRDEPECTAAPVTTTSGQTTEEQQQLMATQPDTKFMINADDFVGIFSSANCQAWQDITNDPLMNLPQSNGKTLVTYAQCLVENCDQFKDRQIFDTLKGLFTCWTLITESNKEKLMMDIQHVRESSSVIDDFAECISVQVTPSQVFDVGCSKKLFQVWLRRVVILIVASISNHCTAAALQESAVPLSDIDQNVLFHITGYMAMKAKNACSQSKKLNNLKSLIENLATKEPKEHGHVVEKYKEWVSKQSRGGLLYPVPNLYLLVREFDYVFRSSVKVTDLNSIFSMKPLLETAMHESSMVKYYWKLLIESAHEDEVKATPVLDYLVALFLTIKGFALARKERDRLTMKTTRCKDVKPSKSLRGRMK